MMRINRTGQSYKHQLKSILFFGFIIFILSLGCSSRLAKFNDAPVITTANDKKPVPVPKSSNYEKLFYTYDVLFRNPMVNALDVSKIPSAMDVNATDNVITSSWYTPRLGFRDITSEELLHGLEEIGPPQKPFYVSKAKKGGGNPGFIIKDSRGKSYLLKFDPPEFPGIETTTDLIVSRLFWGFGYNVPEDYLIYFNKNDLLIDDKSELSINDLTDVLHQVAEPVDNVYRATASLWLQGIFLGPVPAEGTRKDDLNDRIPHENLRILRALKVFCSFVNHSDIRIDNSADIYTGEPGKGHVEHYLLDFGEAFGGHGAEHDYKWDGFEHYFSYSSAFNNFIAAGLKIHNWEKLEYTPWKSVGAFESDKFNPGEWKEVYPYLPIRSSQPADDYWAAKILAALTDEHITALVKAADYPEPDAEAYMIKTLIQRRDKVLKHFMDEVSPIEFESVNESELAFVDNENLLLDRDSDKTDYQIDLLNPQGKKIKTLTWRKTDNKRIIISLDKDINANRYSIIRITKLKNAHIAPSAAEFHFAVNTQNINLVGVVH